MLNKLFGNKKSSDISTVSNQGRHDPTPRNPSPSQSRALKIVHAGGNVEHYYMATPASMIIQKHPSFVLARPEIFRRPWDSVVGSDEILVPGQKYYVVPLRTVKKLRRRIRKPSATGLSSGSGFSFNENTSQSSISSFRGILVKPGIKTKARNRHVRFYGLDSTNEEDASSNSIKKAGNKSLNNSKGRLGNEKKNEKKGRARFEFAALESITE